MRGHCEESPEIKALRQLRDASRKFVGEYLRAPFDVSAEAEAERGLKQAAIAYAATQPKPRKKRAAAPKTGGPNG